LGCQFRRELGSGVSLLISDLPSKTSYLPKQALPLIQSSLLNAYLMKAEILISRLDIFLQKVTGLPLMLW